MKKTIIATILAATAALSFNASAGYEESMAACKLDNPNNDRVTAVQQTLCEEGVLRAESDRINAANADAKNDKIVAEQDLVDAAQDEAGKQQDTAIKDNKLVNTSQQAEIDKNTATNESQQVEIDNNTAVNKTQQVSIDKNTTSVLELYETTAVNADGIATNKADIAENKAAINTLFGEVDRLDDKIDGVMAGVHAVNNARPYLSSRGETAVGVGMGYAGDSSAIAIGAAHAFTDGLSASMTLNVTTGSNSEVSGGAGVQYKF